VAQVADTFASLADGEAMALIFGREDSGLTREEVMQCQRTASIATTPDFPTMNLAQAVGIFCFALSTQRAEARLHIRPDAALIERLHERLESLLLEVGFLQENNPDRIYDDLRAMLGRADIDEREATILLGIIRQIEWKLGR
jgi:tRNA/rRNA methyltransferase